MSIMRTGQENFDRFSKEPIPRVHRLKSLEKGLRLLEAFGPDAPSMTLTELAQRCGFHLSTVQRLTATLSQLGYLKRDHQKRYHLGLKVVRLGFHVTQSIALKNFLLPYLYDLFKLVDESVNLFLHEGDEVVIVERLEKRRMLQYFLHTGSSLPMYCTAAGKAILSHLKESEIDEYLKRVPLTAFTPYTITDPGILMKELRACKSRGFAVNQQELGLGACAIGVAILDKEGTPQGAVSVASPQQHFRMQTVREKILKPLMETARIASEFLGFQEKGKGRNGR